MNELPELPHEINSPEPWLPGVYVPWWGWVLIGLAAILLLALLISLLKGKAPPAPADLPSLYAEYCRELESLGKNLAGKPLAFVATEASLIIRGYLAKALAEPTLYETHEETLTRADALLTLPEGARERLTPLLHRLAEYKYGPSRTDESLASNLVTDCREVLSGVHSTQPQQIA